MDSELPPSSTAATSAGADRSGGQDFSTAARPLAAPAEREVNIGVRAPKTSDLVPASPPGREAVPTERGL